MTLYSAVPLVVLEKNLHFDSYTANESASCWFVFYTADVDVFFLSSPFHFLWITNRTYWLILHYYDNMPSKCLTFKPKQMIIIWCRSVWDKVTLWIPIHWLTLNRVSSRTLPLQTYQLQKILDQHFFGSKFEITILLVSEFWQWF